MPLCVAVTSTPSDGDTGPPDEDTFGVSFLVNDVDETAAKDVALGLNRELLCVCFSTNPNSESYLSKDPCRGLRCVLTCSAEAQRQNTKAMLQSFFKVLRLGTNDVDDGNTVPPCVCSRFQMLHNTRVLCFFFFFFKPNAGQ